MASLTHDDLVDQFSRVQRLGDLLGAETSGWTLVPGELGKPGVKRQTWAVNDKNGRRVLTLGYTRRTAMDVLTAVANAYEAVLAAPEQT